MTQLLIGDKNCSDDSLYSIPITIKSANMLANSLALRTGTEAVFFVVSGIKTRRRYGTVKNVGGKMFEIKLNSIGMNVGTLLHEMAHVTSTGKIIEGHPVAFRNRLAILTVMYNNVWRDG